MLLLLLLLLLPLSYAVRSTHATRVCPAEGSAQL
jgi:hypothetical protein